MSDTESGEALGGLGERFRDSIIDLGSEQIRPNLPGLRAWRRLVSHVHEQFFQVVRCRHVSVPRSVATVEYSA